MVSIIFFIVNPRLYFHVCTLSIHKYIHLGESQSILDDNVSLNFTTNSISMLGFHHIFSVNPRLYFHVYTLSTHMYINVGESQSILDDNVSFNFTTNSISMLGFHYIFHCKFSPLFSSLYFIYA